MLSHQTSKTPTNTDDRRQHQRQQSTPTVFEAPDTTFHPATHQLSASHRRGMSLNQPAAHLRQHHPQDGHLVSITNTGQSQQHYLQEAQQHRQARPGLHQQHQHHHHHQQQLQQQLQQQGSVRPIQLSEQEFRNLQHQQLDAHIDSLLQSNNNNLRSFNNNDQHVVKIERSRSHPEPSHGVSQAQPLQHSASESPAQALLDPRSLGGAQSSARRPIARSEAGDDGPSRHDWKPQSQRPFTPPDQCNTGRQPLTPGTSPRLQFSSRDPQSQKTSRPGSRDDDSSVMIRTGHSPVKVPQSSHALVQLAFAPSQMNDPNATVKARHRPAPLQSLTNADLFHAGHMDISTEAPPSPPHSATIQQSGHLDVAFMPGGQAMDHLHLSFSPAGSPDLFASAQSFHGSPQASPEMSPVRGSQDARNEYRGDICTMIPLKPYSNESSPSHTATSSIDFDILDSPTRAAADSPGAMSMSDLNLDATIEDTGISAEEVQAYISQPDPETGKWTCLYPECGKTFGRKENVRAHVQTHLGDRQFKCIHCGKCFVRQHDLKRHSKTHSGVKPYPCRCGNSFARHDALTRHRQRGICTGGFEGVVKKVAKRGRPRKERPNHDDRVDKAARTRKRAAAKSYASSVSGTSESSFPDSPPFLFDGVEFDASKANALQSFNPQSFTLDPDILNFSPPPSPYSTGGPLSPKKAQSTVSGHTPKSTSFDDDQTAAIFESMNVTDSSQTTAGSNVGSQVGSPPELSHSSPPSSTRLLDFDFGTNFNSSGSGPSDVNKHDSASFESLHDDMFTSSWNENAFLNFEKDSNTLAGNLFSNSFDDDIMFSDNCETGGGFF